MAANLRPLARKLQTALALRQGRRFTISQYQAWSAKANRMVTKYVVAEYFPDAGNYQNRLATWNYAEIVKYFAAELNGGNADAQR